MRQKILITKQQHRNLLEAMDKMWPTVPAQNVSRGLTRVCSTEVSATSVLDFGSWCARWPKFMRQGMTLNMVTGRPILDNTESPVIQSRVLFGNNNLFMYRGVFITDGSFPDATDHEIITQRLAWVLRNSQVK